MKTYTSLAVLLLFAFSSCKQYYIKKGDNYYKTMQYEKAAGAYNKGLGKKPSDAVKIKLADSYRLNNDYKNAEKWYSEVVNIQGVAPENYFYYAKVLMSNGNYKEAKNWFMKYSEIMTEDPRTKTLMASCDSCNRFYKDSSRYAIKEVKIPDVTTAFGQVNFNGGLVFAADKTTFNSSQKESGWTGRSYLDMYYSKKNDDGSWTAPEPLKGEVNGVYHEGPAVFNAEGSRIYFTRSNYGTAKKLRKNGEDVSNLKIYYAELVKGIWTDLYELPFNSDDYSCGHPALSPDGKTLFFISDMPGGNGGTDLYKSTREIGKDGKEEWSKPQNLGSVINTAGNEMFPYVHKDGTMYFSSDAHNTLGGLDIFSSVPDGNNWSEPQNLNYPISSSKDDFAFVLNEDGKTGYISSNRSETDKIYEVKMADLIFIVKGKVTDRNTGELLVDAVVEITNNKDNYIQSIPVDDNGNYWMRLKAGVDYSFQAGMDGYLKPVAIEIATSDKKRSQVFKADFQLEKIQTEKPIVLDNIYYDLDKWIIRKDAAAELDKFVVLLNNNPQINVELRSHTDARAEDNYNTELSEKRAKAAVEYLVKKGIDPNRLKWKGYGETVLVNDCGNGVKCPDLKHQENRRTEFQIIKINEMAGTK
ncbi:MAG TPA: OmpA family protein [Bacteroidia bacterium]|jgi:outer membrane protein OmpA-like peptidoglycan-associated protein